MVQTMNLDGETNLKRRRALYETNCCREIASLGEMSAKIYAEAPTKIMHTFVGSMHLKGSEQKPLTLENLIMRGTTLQNTQYAIGVCVYTGQDTRIVMNSAPAPAKMSRVEQMTNQLIMVILVIQAAFCLTQGLLYSEWISSGEGAKQWYLYGETLGDGGAQLNGIKKYFSYMILLLGMVPISLYVTLEIVKFLQRFLMMSDLQMYYEAKDQPFVPRTTALNEELGQVDYIFSDKTGTLTQNSMDFKCCWVAGVSYGATEADESEACVGASGQGAWPHVAFNDPTMKNDLAQGSYQQQQDIRKLLLQMAICHTINTEATGNDFNDGIAYEAESPDENSFVWAAASMGYRFRKRVTHEGIQKVTVDLPLVPGEPRESEEFTLLQTLEFSSARAKMSTIVKCPDGTIEVWTKGADSKIMRILDPTQDADRIQSASEAADRYSNLGLRTLMWSYKQISQAEYSAWEADHSEAANSIEKREEKLAEVNARMERNLTLIGVTAVEDLLQDGVPDTIELLRAGAGIKIWVLTGDKQGTAINIAKSCRLTTDQMEQFILNVDYSNPALEGKLSAAEKNRKDIMTKLDAIRERLKVKALSTKNLSLQMSEQYSSAPPNSSTLVVDGLTLECIFDTCNGEFESLWLPFLEIATQMVSVTCCRVSPDMKALVCLGVKEHHPMRPITLSVGDGANDVPMIQAAHVGIGISGVEGRQAVQSSDYAIGQFRFLQQLLLVHGRYNYIRNTFAVCYSFYKNLSFTPAQYWWAFESAFSGQKLYIEAGYQLFNVAFSALPVIAYGIWEQDVSPTLSLKYPQLYKVGRRNELYNSERFLIWLFHGLYHSLVIYYVPRFCLGNTVDSYGEPADSVWYLGSAMFGICVIIINFTIGIFTKYWFWIHHFFIWLDIVGWWILLLLMIPVSLTYSADNTGGYMLIKYLYRNITVWLTMLLASAIALLPTMLLSHFQDSQSLGHCIREVEEAQLRSSIWNCGLCGCPCGEDPYCCGDGCVDRSKTNDDEERGIQMSQLDSSISTSVSRESVVINGTPASATIDSSATRHRLDNNEP